MFTHKYRYLFALLLSVYTYLNTEVCQLYYYFNLKIDWYSALLTITAVTFFSMEINRQLEPLLKKLFPSEKSIIKYKVAFFIAGTLLSTLLTVLIVLFVGMVVHSFTFAETVIPVKLTCIYCVLINLLFHLINTIIFYFKEYKSTRLEAEELKVATTQAELQLLRSQLNPHFLFNNLNVLSALILKDNAEANQFIEEFSKVYRYILNNNHKELVVLQEELDFIRPYIFLLEKRFAHGLKIEMNIDECSCKNFIIPASLQMLIENAIKHNIVSRRNPMTIKIYTDAGNTISVSNNLQEKESLDESTGIGLKNIVKRYELVSNKTVDISKTNTGFCVTLPLINFNDN